MGRMGVGRRRRGAREPATSGGSATGHGLVGDGLNTGGQPDDEQ